MFPPGTSYPFLSQNPDIIYTPQQPGMQGQQYPQQFMPMQQPMQMQQPMPMQPPIPMQPPMPIQQYYPLQDPDGMYRDSSFTDIGREMSLTADPPPLLSNNPVTATIVLFKELTAYPNYGNPSRNADILYTGNRGTWTFESPAFLFVPGNLRAQIRIRAVLDDHSNVPVNRYSARITINGNVVHNGRVPLEHGAPAGGIFTNWRDLTFNVQNLRRVNQVTIVNTSTAGPDDWIGLDWMEIRLVPR